MMSEVKHLFAIFECPFPPRMKKYPYMVLEVMMHALCRFVVLFQHLLGHIWEAEARMQELNWKFFTTTTKPFIPSNWGKLYEPRENHAGSIT